VILHLSVELRWRQWEYRQMRFWVFPSALCVKKDSTFFKAVML